jgi:hypothetical protein
MRRYAAALPPAAMALGTDAWATTVNVTIDMAVVVQDNQAVALTFAGHTRLSESRKIALLRQAAALADR